MTRWLVGVVSFVLSGWIGVADAQILLEKDNVRRLSAEGEGSGVEINVVATVKGDRPRSGMSAASWGVAWKCVDGSSDTLSLQWGNTDFGMDGDCRFLRVSCGGESQDIPAIHAGQESLALSLTVDGDGVMWCIGQDRLMGRGNRPGHSIPDRHSFVIFSRGRDLVVDRVVASMFPVPVADAMTSGTSAEDFPVPDEISSSPAGVWRYLDRDNDPAWSRPGGKYTLGIMPDQHADGSWTIVYLDGALTNSGQWRPGMIKGHLEESGFLRDYNLEWTDAMHVSLGRDDECSARLSDDGMILTLVFPLDKATLRFSRQF